MHVHNVPQKKDMISLLEYMLAKYLPGLFERLLGVI